MAIYIICNFGKRHIHPAVSANVIRSSGLSNNMFSVNSLIIVAINF